MAVSREQLIFDAFANTDRAGANLAALGRKAGAAGDDVMGLAKRLDELSRKSADARVGLQGDKDALAKLDKLDLKLAVLGNKTVSPNVTIEGAARASVEISALGVELDHLSKKSASAGGAASSLAGTGGMAGGGLGALIAAGVVLSPVIASLAVGAAGFGAAAAGVVMPIEKAAKAAGGLQANMSKLDAEQQTVAKGILGLGKEYAAFEAVLKPTVLHDFNAGLQLAGHVLHDVEPVAVSFGKAFGGFLGQIDRMFSSSEWQSFFSFMARTAGPDLKLVGSLFVNLANDLPPLLVALQPVATALLKTASGLALAGRAAEQLSGGPLTAMEQFGRAGNSIKTSSTGVSGFNAALDILVGPKMTKSTDNFFHSLSEGFKILTGSEKGQISIANRAGSATGDLIHPLGAVTGGLASMKTATDNEKAAVQRLTTALNVMSSGLLTNEADQVAWRQAQQAATKAINQNKASLDSNRASALAARAAIIQSTQSALAFANQQVKTGHDTDGASRTLQAQINWLRQHAGHSKIATDEIDALRAALQKLKAQGSINTHVTVTGTGSWQSDTAGGKHVGRPGFAAGGRVGPLGMSGGGDRYPILAEAGELIVPASMVNAGAVDHLRGRLPGFASGGIVGSYSGSPGGLAPWASHNWSASIRDIIASIAQAMASAFKNAIQQAMSFGAPGPARHAAIPWLQGLWDAAGGPPGLAHLMAAIAMAESGGNPNAYNPSGATGLWQILGAVDPRDQPFLRNPAVNAHEAVLKWRTQGLGAWVTYTSGAYKQYYDQGGWLPPGPSIAINNTGRPERVLPPGGGGNTYNITVNVPPTANKADTGRVIVEHIREFERRSGPGWRK